MRALFSFFFLLGIVFTASAQTMADSVAAADRDIPSAPDTLPKFPGGDQAFAEFISSHLVYPKDARKQGIEGKTYTQFTVEKDGSISAIKTVNGKGLSPSCDQAVIDVLLQSPRWQPAMKDGLPIRCKMIVPVKFTLDQSVRKK
ncbi:energy transducer TonB [Cytophaga hutchinsonii]|uniref:TonB-related protein n=1 Tax=Cytophaga hutchinsonii (strain ATCC 33406 / DSM 1761 / CIP 103989 / NBRC 15051 / NCIMB 9469 / D465) TaxID=269798 RepID=A0A6N4SN57_CYTH3|nr:energy transducer TonB [Cytophaga hutchinsonii]ABG57709.1 tonB-related protein [Cytophaga hutchinsonii ATCC 33406]